MKTNRVSLGILAAVITASAFFASCSKDDTPSLPPIGGYNTADEVGASNLVAYWGFNGDGKEGKSGVAPEKTENASFTTGVKGQAVSFANGYMRYPSISALNNATGFGSFTVSAWVNAKNLGNAASCIFALNETPASAKDWGGPINVMLETGSYKPTSDTLVLKGVLGQYASGTREGHDNLNNYGDVGVDYQVVKGAGKWTQIVMKYDASTSTIDIYGNGIVVSNKKFRVRKDGKLGALVFPATTSTLIGGFANATTGYPSSAVQGWQSLFNGQIDEIRVFNKALSDGDISALFQLESAGR
ncbi:LamG-like jellyroll fold domain-containing protein [Emticicia sp. 17c]|uniref:LamG-like jellyroll fold domain-containing protein n=1 Tax=Emticicia sp. 17c TaxID=3127704 RepID=UPI00301CCF09